MTVEGFENGPAVGAVVLDQKPHHLQRHGPAFGAAVEFDQFLAVQPRLAARKQRLRLDIGKGELGDTDLPEFIGKSQRRTWQMRRAARDDDEFDMRKLGSGKQPRKDAFVRIGLREMVIVDEQGDRAGQTLQPGYQNGQHRGDRQGSAIGLARSVRDDGIKHFDQRQKKSGLVVVIGIERNPKHGHAASGEMRMPLRRERGLAVAGRGNDQIEATQPRLRQALQQGTPRDLSLIEGRPEPDLLAVRRVHAVVLTHLREWSSQQARWRRRQRRTQVRLADSAAQVFRRFPSGHAPFDPTCWRGVHASTGEQQCRCVLRPCARSRTAHHI